MRKVLIISYAFPPMGVVGAYRPAKFCKFLPEFGWHPTVLTVNVEHYDNFEHSLLNELHQSIRIYRSKSLDPLLWFDQRANPERKKRKSNRELPKAVDLSRAIRSGFLSKVKQIFRSMLSIPDGHNFWIPFAIYTGLRAIKEQGIDVLFSTSPPASGHMVGYVLSLLTGLPLITDFRDLWILNPSYGMKGYSGVACSIDRFLERRVILRSNGIITTCGENTESMRLHNSFKSRNKFHTIMNGLDADDFKDLKFPARKTRQFTMLHLGNLYGFYNPDFFFEAVSKWFQRRPEVTKDIIIHFIGNTGEYRDRAWHSMLRHILIFTKRIPHLEATKKLMEADLLLIIIGFEKDFSGVIPQKLFEYVVTGLPILGFVPHGEAERIIEKYQRGLAVTRPDIENTCNFLDTEYNNWKASTTKRQSEFFLPPEFDRRRHAEKLAQIISKAQNNRNA